MMYKFTFLLCFIFIMIIRICGQESEPEVENRSFTIKGDWYVAHQWFVPNRDNNAFKLKRGYLTVENTFNNTFSARYTQDITIDNEGDDAGNVELRFKYCYLKVQMPKGSVFTNSYFEVGLVHRPWIDFEEHINDYRVQGEMFLERSKIISSADFGLIYVTLFGGKLDKEYQETVSGSYPGKYGSFAIGIYNGGGYHALEKNNNKTVEARLSLRPFPTGMPGMQLSYNMALGKGNDTVATDFRLHSFYASYESKSLTLTAQYYAGKGNMSGANEDKNNGYSFFGEFVIPKTRFMLFSRYDHFKPGTGDPYQIIIGGLGWRFYKQNKIIFDVDWCDRENITRIYEIALEITF